MKRLSPRDMPTEDIVARFVEISVAQDNALMDDETAAFNRLYREKSVLLEELKSRTGDQRSALLDLFSHENPQVRLNAATATLAIAPTAAKQVLQALTVNKLRPQALDAGSCLRNLEDGIFKPS